METESRLNQLLNKLILNGTSNQFKLFFHRYHEADIADAVEQLPIESKTLFFNKISISDGAEVLEEMSIDDQIELIRDFKVDTAAEIIEKMDKDDAVDLLEALLDKDKDSAQDLLNRMDLDDQIQLKRLLSYQEDTAGGLMNPDYVSIPEMLTVEGALEKYRQISPDKKDTAFYLFIVNEFQQIKGVLSIRDLLLAPTDMSVKEIRNNYPIKVHVDNDKEDVAKIFQKYRSIVLPVVDDLDILLGVITVDDIVEVVVEEANEDMYKLSGTAGEDVESKKLLFGNIFYSIWHRLPWLGVSIVGGVLASIIMVHYSLKLSEPNVSLAVILSFVPLLIGLGGNVGNQSATIVVRALAMKDIAKEKNKFTIYRETSIGLIIGVILAVFITAYVYITTGNAVFAGVVGLTIGANMAVASFIGAMLPIVLQALKIDPAIASAPFISTALDVIGQIIYFSIALWLFSMFI